MVEIFFLGFRAKVFAAEETFRVVTYNVENYVVDPDSARPMKTQAAKSKVWESILVAKPDVLALEEIGSSNALIEIQGALEERGLSLPYSELIQGFDTNIHVAVLSRFVLDARNPHTNDSYLLNGQQFYVSRGFAEVEVEVNTHYSFTLLAAHLKSKRKVGYADESDMRLEEVRLLRKHVDECFDKDKNVNLLVLGDMNDLRDSKTVRCLIGRGNRALTDTRPGEQDVGNVPAEKNPSARKRPVCWTEYFEKEDLYSRLDYILVSRGMAREWIESQSSIPVVHGWGEGSDHRPVVATFHAEDR